MSILKSDLIKLYKEQNRLCEQIIENVKDMIEIVERITVNNTKMLLNILNNRIKECEETIKKNNAEIELINNEIKSLDFL